jgi:hypothetical protein
LGAAESRTSPAVGVGLRAQHAVLDARVDHLERPVDRPAPAALVVQVAARCEAQLARGGRDRALARGRPPQREVHAFGRKGDLDDARDQRFAAFAQQHVDHRAALGGAQRHLGVSVARARRREHGEVRERALQVDRLLDRRVRVVGHHDHRVLVEEAVGAAAGMEDTLELAVGGGDRVDLRVRAVAVRVGVVVGQRQQQEVEQVVLDEVGAHAAGVLVADPREAQLRAARRLAAGEDVGVEQLLGAHHRAAHDGRGQASERGGLAQAVLVAPAVHQVGRPRGTHAGVVERLEDRRHVGRQVLGVHVVDGVGELLDDPEAPRRAERRPVLDVAALVA